MQRSRLNLFFGLMLVMALGLASRKFSWLVPDFLGKYPGDSLWAWMVFLLVALLWPRAKTFTLAALALVISFLVEFSQLYQEDWINQIRATTLGHLVLGSKFSWFDLVAYTFGILAAAVIDDDYSS